MNIPISPETHQRLQNLMQPYENFELVVRRLIDGYEKDGDEPESTAAQPSPTVTDSTHAQDEDDEHVIVCGPVPVQPPPNVAESDAEVDPLASLTDSDWEALAIFNNAGFSPKAISNAMQFGKDDYVSLTHTKILRVSINGELARDSDGKPVKTKWNSIVEHLIQLIYHRDGSVKLDLHHKLPLKRGQIEGRDDGYKWVSGTDVSFQGLSAENARPIISDLAMDLGLSMRILFGWRNNRGAKYPNECGIFKLGTE